MFDLNDGSLYTKEELAQGLKISERTVDRHVVEGMIPAPIYVGTRPRWLRSTIQEWFLAGCPGGGSKRVMPRRDDADGIPGPSLN